MRWPENNRKLGLVGLGALIATILLASTPASAHVFGRNYTLPVPLHLYQAAAAGALLISFLALIWILRRGLPPWVEGSLKLVQAAGSGMQWGRWLLVILRALSFAAMALAIAAGWLGHANPYVNFSMTYFWVVFVLGFFYLHVLFGNLLLPLNPWRILCEWMARPAPGLFAGRLRAPERFGYLPALILYIAFIWFELYGAGKPVNTAMLLSAYALINLVGTWTWGLRAWLRYGEFFSVLFRLVSHLAPLAVEKGQLLLRWPVAGLLKTRTDGYSHLLFIIFMLASTAFDGIVSMVSWLEMTWRFLQDILAEAMAADPQSAVALLQSAFKIYHAIGLALSPLWYFAVYALVLALARLITRDGAPLHTWLLRFGMSLVPIAVVYHAAHYYTLLQVQGGQLVPLLADPLGRGWNLFSVPAFMRVPAIPDPAVIWHIQVGLILFGHLLGVLAAHMEAMRSGKLSVSLSRLIAGQIPLFLLMVLLTVFGLWILAQPAT